MARTYPRTAGGDRARRTNARKNPEKRQVRLPARSSRGGRFGKIKQTILRVLGITLITLFIAGICFAAGGYLGLVRSVNQIQLATSGNVETHPTYIYSAPLGDSDGSRRVIGTIFQGQNRKTATLDQMPSHLLNAVVAKEDERFREHAGVDVWGIMRALYVDIRAGEAVEGASTITQQYVRNAYLSQDVSITRKVKEALIAIQIETKSDKDDILSDYLNTAYYGNNAYGIEAASETYFNKSVSDLSVAESATLVGLVWSPSTLGEDKGAAKDQRDLVLNKMFDTGYLTRQDHEAALEEPMPEEWPVAAMVDSGLTGPQMTRNFTKMVEDELVQRYGANTVLQGGLSVDTTLDLEAQQAAQEIIYGDTGYLADPSLPDAALVSIDQSNGHIVAMVGNRDQSSQFNLATQGRRQPGSSFKPFALIAALQQGVDPETQFVSEDKKYNIQKPEGGTEKWKVENYDEIVRGAISIKDALWESDNTVFTDLVMNVGGKGLENGPQAIAEVANSLGITEEFPNQPLPSIVLGTYEVSPLEMTRAYATIANDGRKVEPTAITRVVQNEGQDSEKVLLAKEEAPEGEQAISPEIAHQMTEMMLGDVMWGIASDAALDDGRPVAGKTGTSESFFDSWFIGYTPEVTTGIWMGYGEGGATLEDYLSRDGAAYGAIGSPEEIYHDYMTQVMSGRPVEQFDDVELPPPPPDAASAQNAQTQAVPQTSYTTP